MTAARRKGKCRQCGRRLGSRAEKLYDTPSGAVYLCGRKRCLDSYNDGAPPAPAREKRCAR